MDVLGVDWLSVELRGRLLVEELVELNVLKLKSTLCGFCFVFCNTGVGKRYLGLRSELFPRLAGSSLVKDNWPLANLEEVVFLPLASKSLEVLRLGEGDLEELSHDFLANVAKDSDTVLVLLSLTDLGIEGTGGASFRIVLSLPPSPGRSGEPLTRCIHDFGRATKDFLLPILSSLGRSSLGNRLVGFPSFSFCDSCSVAASAGTSADTNLCISFSSSADRQLKLAARGSCSSCPREGV